MPDGASMPDDVARTDGEPRIWTPSGDARIEGGRLVTGSGYDFLRSPHEDAFNFGSDEYCVEAIVTLLNHIELPLLGKWSTIGDQLGYFMGGNPSGSQVLYARLSVGELRFPTGHDMPLNQRLHLAWYRPGSGSRLHYMAVNGNVASSSFDADIASVNTSQMIGATDYQGGSRAMRMEQFRVRRGPGSSYPRTTFTPPSSI